MFGLRPRLTPFPYTTLFRSRRSSAGDRDPRERRCACRRVTRPVSDRWPGWLSDVRASGPRRPSCRSRRCHHDLTRTRGGGQDRKSTRLNSSHLGISYAVFCLNVRPTSETYTLSLHDALPISSKFGRRSRSERKTMRLPSCDQAGERSMAWLVVRRTGEWPSASIV